MVRLGSAAMLVLALACGPTVSEPADETSSGSVGSGGSSTTTGSTTGTTGTTGNTSTTDPTDPDTFPGESGCLDGCGMCPWEPCPPGETCDENTLMCVPIPDELPACDDPTWVIEPVEIPIGLQAIDLTFVDVDGVGGRELVLVDDNGALEIRTPTLDPWTTSALPQAVTRIFAADVDGDAFGDLIARATPNDAIFALSGDGTGTFMSSVQFMPGGIIGAIAVGDWNDDGLDDVAVVTLDDGATVVSAVRDPAIGFVVVDSIPIEGEATSLVAIPANDGTGWDLAVGAWQSIFRLEGVGDGTFEPSGEAGSSFVVDLAGFRGIEGTGTQVAAIGTNEPGVALELYDSELGTSGGFPLPQVGSPRRIAAFGDPWSFAKDLLVVLHDGPTILVIVEPWADVPCVIEVDAGPAVSVALGYTYPLIATETSALVRLDFP